MTEQNYSPTFQIRSPLTMTTIYNTMLSQALALTDENNVRAKGLVSYIDEFTHHNDKLTQMIFDFSQANRDQKLTQNVMGAEISFYSLNKRGDKTIIYHPNKVQTIQLIQGKMSAMFDLRAGEVIPVPPGKVCVLENKGDMPAKAWSVVQKNKN